VRSSSRSKSMLLVGLAMVCMYMSWLDAGFFVPLLLCCRAASRGILWCAPASKFIC
jgi:hypothetical protein